MYGTAYFSRMPRAKIPGTRMKKPQIVAGTCLHGKIIPLFCNMVMPGQIDSCIANGAIWMSTPIAPLLSQIKGKINVFYVPMRLVWEHTKEFFGENTTSAGPQQTQYVIPNRSYNSWGYANQPKVGSVSHYLGKPLPFDNATITSTTAVSSLKERAFWLCYSEYYRHEQVQNPVLLTKNDTAAIGTLNGVAITLATMPPSCLKDFDYFTTATINPNYGGEVLLPLGTSAPVYTGAYHSNTLPSNAVTYADVQGNPANDPRSLHIRDYNSDGTGRLGGIAETAGNADVYLHPDNLYADLSLATAAKIDDLYTAMAAQAFYHNQNFGSKYWEMTAIHYGVVNPDLVIDRPEHVSEFTFDIIVQDVISQAGAASDATTKLGQPGGVSKTYIRKKLYHHSFGEWGFVIALLNTYHQRYYSGGVAREDLYSELFDFYFPEFANRGDDSIYDAELLLKGGKSTFGYQEAYADRRYYIPRVTGQLDPQAGGAFLGPWVLAEPYTSSPTLSASFIEEDRTAIASALVTGSNGPDYIWSFNFEHTEILPMPAYTKPGIPRFGRV